jgi:hypothetical protein
MTSNLYGVIAITVLGATACGSDSLTGLEGVYTVSTWTDNPAGCTAEGPSVATDHDGFFYVKSESFIGSKFVNVPSCASVAECQAKASDDGTINLGGFAFEDGSDSAGWTTHNAFAFGSSGSCMGDITDALMTSTNDGIRIESRTTMSAPFTGECTDEAAEAAAAGQPCTSLEVVTASFTADF